MRPGDALRLTWMRIRGRDSQASARCDVHDTSPSAGRNATPLQRAGGLGCDACDVKPQAGSQGRGGRARAVDLRGGAVASGRPHRRRLSRSARPRCGAAPPASGRCYAGFGRPSQTRAIAGTCRGCGNGKPRRLLGSGRRRSPRGRGWDTTPPPIDERAAGWTRGWNERRRRARASASAGSRSRLRRTPRQTSGG